MKTLVLAITLSWVSAQSADLVAVFTAPPRQVPTHGMPDGPLLGNGDVGVVLAGPPEVQKFYIGKNDFWRRTDASIETIGNLTLAIPALRGATYRQEQDMANAEVRGTFTKDQTTVHTRSWVDANENILVTELQCGGHQPVDVSLSQTTGESGDRVPATVTDNDRVVTIGREWHGGGRWYFNGSLADVSTLPRALPAEEVLALAGQPTPAGKVFDGLGVFEERPSPKMKQAVSVIAWIKIEGTNPEANYIVSKGDWYQAYSLGLSDGRLRWAVNGTFAQTKERLKLHQWIHVAGTFDGRRLSVYVAGALKAQCGADAGGGAVDGKLAASWFTRPADARPESREAAVVSRFIGAMPRTNAAGELTVTLQPGGRTFLATSVLTDLDAKNFLAAARTLVCDLSPARIENLSVKHRAWWSDFWSRSFIGIPDQEIEQHWFTALYVLGSCSRAGRVAPGLWGNWITTDHPSWHGDFHLNYNFQAPFYLVYSANHADLSLPFYQAIWESVPNGRKMAQRHGWKGVHFPVSIGPWGFSPEDSDGDWGQRSDAAFAALNFIWHYQYTQDVDFLQRTAYPYLLEVADFWEDYLKFENGRYVIYSDSIHEGSGPDFNPLLSLGLVRTLFKNMIVMSKDLGVDADRRAKWQDIGDKISVFPTQERDGKTVFRYSEKGMAWNDGNTLGIHQIFPAGAIGLDSNPMLLEICRNTINAMSRWSDNNGFSSWYTACARVGCDPKTILAKLHAECDQHSLPNCLLSYGGGGIESCGGFLAVNEMLFQSHEGILRFFPCWPMDEDARFGGLRAVGAFLVSAELKAGIVTGVKIVSEKGRPCTVQNPWPGKKVQLLRNGTGGEVEWQTGERFTFKTAVGESIELQP